MALPDSIKPRGSILGWITGRYARAFRIARWENIARIHLMTEGPDIIAHHHCVLRRANDGRREVKVASSVGVHPDVVKRHPGYTDIVTAWIDGRVSDDFVRFAEQTFDENDTARKTHPPRTPRIMSNAAGK